MKKMKLDIQLFNGSVSIQSGSITETTDINLNQSTFTIPAKMTTSGATYNNDNAYMTMQWKYASASSWTTISKQTFGIGKDTSKTKTWTLTLTHNPDGTLENLNFRVQWYITNSTNGTTGTTTVAPTTIPRASQPTASTSTFDLGGTIVISTNRYSSSFTHTMFYSFGNLTNQTSGLSQSTNIGDSVNFTPPLSLATVIPNATSGTCVVTCQTYNGSTLVGTKSVSLTLKVPTNVKPTITNVTQQEVGDVPTSWNTLVQGKSRLKFTITANGAYGSTISSYTTTGNGYTYTTNPATTNYITTSGSLTFNFKVIDSRGREGTGSLSRSPQPYSNPTISTAQVQRCDANGNIDKNGQYMYVSYGASISSCNGYNTSYAVYKIGYRIHNNGSYSYVSLGSNANSKSASGILFTDGIKAVGSTGTKVEFSTNNTFDIQFYAQDYFNPNGITNIQLLDSGFDLMNFNASGKAMAIGKVSEATGNNELLEIGMFTELTTPPGTYNGMRINSSNINEASIVYHSSVSNKEYVVGYGTGSIDGYGIWSGETGQNVYKVDKDGNNTVAKSLKIPAVSTNTYGLVDHNGNSIIRDWDNGTITVDATGGDMYVGFERTNNINLLNGKAVLHGTGGFEAKTIQQAIVSNGSGPTNDNYIKLCNLKFGYHNQGEFASFRIFLGNGNNGYDNQDAYIDLVMQLGWTGSNDGRLGCNWLLYPMNSPMDLSNTNIIVIANSNIDYDIYLWTSLSYCRPNYTYECSANAIVTAIGEVTYSYPSGTQCSIRGGAIGNIASISDTSYNDTPHHFEIGEILVCFGRRVVHSSANALATDTVGFGAYFKNPPVVTVTAQTTVPNTEEKGVGTTNITTSTFDITHYRTNGTNTIFHWVAIGLKA